MHIDWWTILLQAINFLILVWLLQRFLYKPVRRIIDARAQATEDAFAKADAAKAEAEAAEKAFQDKADALPTERRAMIQEARAQIEKERQETQAEAKTEADEIVETARRTVEAERAAALEALTRQAADLAADMAAGTLAGSENPAVTEAFLDAAADHVQHLSADDRAAVGLGGAGGWHVRVSVAHDLTDAAKDRFITVMRDVFGASAEVSFTVTPDLMAGVRVAFPAALVRFNWRDHLDGLKTAVVEPAGTGEA